MQRILEELNLDEEVWRTKIENGNEEMDEKWIFLYWIQVDDSWTMTRAKHLPKSKLRKLLM